MKGKIIKVYRIFQLLKSVDYKEKITRLFENEQTVSNEGMIQLTERF